MDTQNLINISFAVIGFLGGYVINSITRTVNKLEDKMSLFVIKDDYRSDMQDIKNMLTKIFDKLDNKVDK